MRITRMGVIGAGVMGTGIAAHAASAGIPVVLLDVPTDGDRSSLARGAVARALKAKPAPFMSPSHADLITVGNTVDSVHLLADCDLVIEAIIERVEPKQELFGRLESILSPTAIIASNTSSIPIHLLAEGRSDSFKSRFLGAHFFNPVRYLHLLELIPTPATDHAVMARMRHFADSTLGKGVVIAKDAPGFIANRIGIHGMVRALRLMEKYELSIDEVDALTGAFIGRPKSATFRTGDIAGIDVLVHVTTSLSRETGEDFALPDWVHQLVARGALGEKSGAGYYRKERKQILTLDYRTLEYRPQTDAFPEELAFLQSAPLAERLRGVVRAGGRRAEFLRSLLTETFHYTITRTPEIAHDIASVDRAMEWGFGWEIGPFKQADALGVESIRELIAREGTTAPPLLAVAHEAFYRDLASGPRQLTFAGDYAPMEPIAGLIDLPRLHAGGAVVRESKDAALLDIGDGVLLLEFRGKMNTISSAVFPLLDDAARRVRTGAAEGLVIGNADPRTFSAGANLKELAGALQTGDWAALGAAVDAFQRSVMSIRQLPFPVVVAPFGLTLGGACEMMLHADQVQAFAELYCGMPEVGVGLIPGGGGTKEMLFRFTRELEPYEEADPFEAVKRAFKLLSMGTVSTSAADARQLGLLRDRDRVVMNRNRLLSEAKAHVLSLASSYAPPLPMRIRALGREALGNLEYAVWAAREAGYITAHDVTVGRRLAWVLTGGDGPPRDVTEQDVLDLEREAFLSLLGTKETQERIAHMLSTGKPLRN